MAFAWAPNSFCVRPCSATQRPAEGALGSGDLVRGVVAGFDFYSTSDRVLTSLPPTFTFTPRLPALSTSAVPGLLRCTRTTMLAPSAIEKLAEPITTTLRVRLSRRRLP